MVLINQQPQEYQAHLEQEEILQSLPDVCESKPPGVTDDEPSKVESPYTMLVLHHCKTQSLP